MGESAGYIGINVIETLQDFGYAFGGGGIVGALDRGRFPAPFWGCGRGLASPWTGRSARPHTSNLDTRSLDTILTAGDSVIALVKAETEPDLRRVFADGGSNA